MGAPAAFALADAGKLELQAVQGAGPKSTTARLRNSAKRPFAESPSAPPEPLPRAGGRPSRASGTASSLSTWAGRRGGPGAPASSRRPRTEFRPPCGSTRARSTARPSQPRQPVLPGAGVAGGLRRRRAGRNAAEAGLGDQPRRDRSHHFYGDFLARQKRLRRSAHGAGEGARRPDRPGRASADAGRRAEARRLLEQVAANWRKARSGVQYADECSAHDCRDHRGGRGMHPARRG